MAQQYADKATTTTTASMTSGATSMSVTSAALFPSSAPYDIGVDVGGNYEIMTVTAGAGTTTWTVTRGQGTPNATTAVAHASGVTVTAVLTSAGLKALPMGGDVTGPASATTIYALAAGAIAVAAAAFTFSAGGGAPVITQAPKAAATVAPAAAGSAMWIIAQQGQSAGGGIDGGNGADLNLGGGTGGVSDAGGQTGLPGAVRLRSGDADVLDLTSSSTLVPNVASALNLGSFQSPLLSVFSSSVLGNFDAGTTNPAYVAIGNTSMTPTGGSAGPLPFIGFNVGTDLHAATGGYSPYGDINIVDYYGRLAIVDGYGSTLYQFVNNELDIVATTINLWPNLGGLWATNAAVTMSGNPMASTSSATGTAGGLFTISGQPGQNSTGAAHNGGAGGGVMLKMPAGGTSGSATAGAVGPIEIANPSGTVIEYWGATHYHVASAITVPTSGTVTLSAAQLQFLYWTTSTVTLVGATTIAIGNNHVSARLNLSGITFSGQTLTLSCGTGTKALTAITNPIWLVECDGSNHIYVGGS